MKSQLASKLIDDRGVKATLRTFTQSGTNNYGDPEFDSSDQAVTVLKAFTGRLGSNFPTPSNLELGEYRDAGFNFFSTDDIDVDTGPTDKLPELIVGNTLYTVIDTEDVGIGITRILCEQQRT